MTSVTEDCQEHLYGTPGGCLPDAPCRDTLGHDGIFCMTCQVVCSSQDAHDVHIRGSKHKSNAEWGDERPTYREQFSTWHCGLCLYDFPAESRLAHLYGDQHLRKHAGAVLRALHEEAEGDKYDVNVSHGVDGVDFGVISPGQAKQGLTEEITIFTQAHQIVSILDATIRHNIQKDHAVLFTASLKGSSRTLKPGIPLQLLIHFQHSMQGKYDAWLDIKFKVSKNLSFVISRRLSATVGYADDHAVLKPTAPYMPRRRLNMSLDTANVIPSGAPLSTGQIKWQRPLPGCRIPRDLEDILYMDRSAEVVSDHLSATHFRESLHLENHHEYFAKLLWIEEDRLVQDLHIYDMNDVVIEQEGRWFSLKVPGLAENRPSVCIGDELLVQDTRGGMSYAGRVSEIQQESVRLNFDRTFYPEGKLFNVQFQLNRVPLRRQHQALNRETPSLQRILFPGAGNEGLDQPLADEDLHDVDLVDTSIATNDAQLRAVVSILRLNPGAAPFIVFGPPGTGKTVTVTEAILQLVRRDSKTRILACAPSNSAADIIASRLTELSPEELFRCYASRHDPNAIPPDLQPYTHRVPGAEFTLPPVDALCKFRVIVSTCNNASFAYNIGMASDHFSHIFVDEAGQAAEPEALIPIKTMASATTRIILSGDPKQLGPVVHSRIARHFGLERSYLERTMDLPLYDQSGRGMTYIKLTKNYRSHGAILHYPNQQFYEGELEVCGKPASIEAFLRSPQLVNPQWPVIFHAISGKNEREARSPSYFNIEEASQVKDYILALFSDRRFPIKGSEIGVITPYHAQARKIRQLLNHVRIPGVKVGSVEEFQGQERKAIIVSTVRSSGGMLAYDAKFSLGFLSNPRRFNVAMTRAKALLIVVGDSTLLSVDPLWRGFMNYVYENNGWRGDGPTWDTTALVLSNADYAEELREALYMDMRVFAQTQSKGDLEAEANMERGMSFNS